MNKKLLSAVMTSALCLVGCGEADPVDNGPGNTPNLSTSQGIMTFLEGKTLTMRGDDIPSHPNGFSEDVNFGASSQCYQSVTMSVQGGNFRVDSVPGTIEGAPNAGQTGTCNPDLPQNALSFTSTVVSIENVSADGECFDVAFTYPGFRQVGRGSFSADQRKLDLELFFEGGATGANCAAGGVGSASVQQVIQGNSVPFNGNAVQSYVISGG
ncbi:hypothetical protein [Comamonas sp. JC664]|uniref:hypothetical protein n=1 Tax=Comamonas sp. JC664 TaxID=2801917 RepID=UPI00174D80D4|nr:hypothetical protein [Comamonas sp. JC664]MBL0698352.1 hypothetical protein [Comamonas sp. JC664]GHG89759.1 hypothetical protein GCM10012319_49420 [Comamonas sp. KCTC 72670]